MEPSFVLLSPSSRHPANAPSTLRGTRTPKSCISMCDDNLDSSWMTIQKQLHQSKKKEDTFSHSKCHIATWLSGSKYKRRKRKDGPHSEFQMLPVAIKITIFPSILIFTSSSLLHHFYVFHRHLHCTTNDDDNDDRRMTTTIDERRRKR
jgi:hypothetical protein